MTKNNNERSVGRAIKIPGTNTTVIKIDIFKGSKFVDQDEYNQFMIYQKIVKLTDRSIEVNSTLVLNSDFLKDCTSSRSRFGRRYYYKGEYLVYYLCAKEALGEIIYVSLRTDKASGRKVALINSFPDPGFLLRTN